MKEKDFAAKVEELAEQAKQQIIKRCMGYTKNKAISLTDYDNNYRIIRIVITAAIEETSHDFKPLSPDDRRMVKTIQYM